MIKIDSKVLRDFVIKTTANCSLHELLLRTDADGFKTIQRSVDNTTIIIGSLDKKMIANYDAGIGNIGINNTTMFKGILDLFMGIITLDKQGNVLRISGENKSADFNLAEESFMDTALKEELKNISFDQNFKLDSAIFNNVIKHSNTLKSERVTIQVKDKKFSITCGEENNNKISEEINVDYPDCKSVYSLVCYPIMQLLTGQIDVYLKTDYPIQLIEKTEGMIIKNIIAPVSTEE